MELIIPKAPEPRPPMNEAPHGLWSDDELDAEDLINLIPTVDERPPSPINDDRSATAQLADARREVARLQQLLTASARENAALRAELVGARASSGESDDDDRAADDRAADDLVAGPPRRKRRRRARAPRPASPPAPACGCTAAGDDDGGGDASDAPSTPTFEMADAPALVGDGHVEAVAADLVCPITQEVLVEPVVAADGHTYSRRAIEHWFALGKRTSPLTNELLASTALAPDEAARALVAAFVAQHSPAACAPPPPAGAGGAAPADGGGAGVDPLISEIGALLDDEFFDGAWPEPQGGSRDAAAAAVGAAAAAPRALHPDTTRTLEQLVERNALAPLKCFPGADGRAVQLAQLEALVSTCLSLTIARPSQKNGGRGVSKLHILSEAVEAFHAAGPARTVPPVRGNMAEKVLSRIFDEIKRMPQHRALVSG